MVINIQIFLEHTLTVPDRFLQQHKSREAEMWQDTCFIAHKMMDISAMTVLQSLHTRTLKSKYIKTIIQVVLFLP